MINKDYILRIAEQIGRELSILVGLRKRNQNEDALIAIDNALLHHLGLTSRFIDSISDETLVQTLSPLGSLNVMQALWVAELLKVEGEVYTQMGRDKDSYYSLVKSLYLLLESTFQEYIPIELEFHAHIKELVDELTDYELPTHLQSHLFRYYEQTGFYDKAENTLYDLLQNQRSSSQMREQGQAFYQRLLSKSDEDLQAGNFSRAEVYEGLGQLA